MYLYLQVSPNDDHAVLITDAPGNSNRQREQIAEFFFDQYNVPALCIQNPAVLSLFSTGRTTGIILETGESLTHCVPVYEGNPLQRASRLELAGRDITEYLAAILDRHIAFDDVNHLKEKLCYVAIDFEREMANAKASRTSYKLPDGEIVHIATHERFRCAEALFQPNFLGMNGGGIHHMIITSIMECDVGKRKDLYKNVILSGGNAMLRGLAQRMSDEITTEAPSGVNVKICVPRTDDEISAWEGGSIFASLSTFYENPLRITKQMYQENGPSFFYNW